LQIGFSFGVARQRFGEIFVGKEAAGTATSRGDFVLIIGHLYVEGSGGTRHCEAKGRAVGVNTGLGKRNLSW